MLGKADGTSHAGLERGGRGKTGSRRAVFGKAGLGHAGLEQGGGSMTGSRRAMLDKAGLSRGV